MKKLLPIWSPIAVLFVLTIALSIKLGFLGAITVIFSFAVLGFGGMWGLVTILIPHRRLAERNLLTLVFSPLVFSLGAWISSVSHIYIARLFPSVLGIALTIAVVIKSRNQVSGNTKNESLQPVYFGWLLGFLALIPALFVTLSSQNINTGSGLKLYNDVPWQIAMTSEALVRSPEFFPFIDGSKLAYPWSFHGFLGALGSFSGVSAADLFTFVWPVLYAILLPLSLAMFAWKLTKNYWVAIVTPIALVFFVGPTLPFTESLRFPLSYSISPTFEFGLISLLGLFIYLSFSKPHSKIGIAVSLLFAFATVFVASGSKGSSGLIVVCIMLTYFVQALIKKSDRMYTLCQCLFAGLGAIAAYTMTISGSSGNLSIKPLSFISDIESKSVPLMFVVVCAVWTIGSAYLIKRFTLTRSLIFWPAAISIFAGVFFMALFGHPGLSQIYFYWTVVPVIAAFGIWAIALLVKAFGPRITIPLFISWGTAQLLDSQVSYFFDPSDFAKIKWPMIWLVAAVAFALSVSRATSRTNNRKRYFALILAAAAVCSIAAQPFSAFRQVYSGPQAIDGVEISSDQYSAFEYLKNNSSPETIVMTNRHCLSPTSEVLGCDSRYVSLSAFSERRVLIEGHYKESEADQAATLALNERFINSPNYELYMQLWNLGVRFIYIDKTVGITGDYSPYATQVWDSEHAQVWKLNQPAE